MWSGVTRDETILAEATTTANIDDDSTNLDWIAQTAKELLQKKATPGFEYHTLNRFAAHRLRRSNSVNSSGEKRHPMPQERRHFKGVKFHVFEHVSSSKEDDAAQLRVWVFAAVYDPVQVTVKEVQSFLEKIVTLTENMREHDPTWTQAGTLGLQTSFAPILQQRMEEVTYLGHMALLDQKLQACQLQMEHNIDLILERGEKLDDLQTDATKMQEMASVFRKRAKKVRRLKMMQDAKYGVVMGAAITGVASAIVIPSLVAIL